jgi:hypothetical protein
MYWDTTLVNKNITVSNETVTFSIGGLYEVNFSGSIQSNGGGASNGQLYINGSLYSPTQFAFYYGAHGGAGTTQALSFTILYRFSPGDTMYMKTTNIQGNIELPSYLTIKFISL